MANPTVSASLDKTSYSPGELMLLTVQYGDSDTEQMLVTVMVEDSQGNRSEPITVPAIIDPVTVSVSDSDGRQWTKQSDNGSIAVYRAVA